MCKLRPCSRAWPPKQVPASAFAGSGQTVASARGCDVPRGAIRAAKACAPKTKNLIATTKGSALSCSAILSSAMRPSLARLRRLCSIRCGTQDSASRVRVSKSASHDFPL
jgi:hypothetical protein